MSKRRRSASTGVNKRNLRSSASNINNNNNKHEETSPPDQEIVEEQQSRRNSAIKQRHNNNGWTVDQENIVKNWGEICRIYGLMNYDAQQHFLRRDLFLGALSTVGNAVIACSGFAIAGANVDCEWQRLATFITASVTIVVAAVMALYSFLQYGKRAASHATASHEYTALYHEIQLQLIHRRRDRENGQEFEDHILRSLNRLLSGIQAKAPFPESIRRQWYAKLQNNPHIAKPDIVSDKLEPIQMHEHSSSSSSSSSLDHITTGPPPPPPQHHHLHKTTTIVNE